MYKKIDKNYLYFLESSQQSDREIYEFLFSLRSKVEYNGITINYINKIFLGG